MKAQQAQDKRRKKKKVRIAIIVVVVLALLVGEFIVLMDHWVSPPSLSGGLSDGNPDDGITTDTEGRKKGCYTFLIAGKDRAAGLTDTVLVGMLDTENKSLKFVSIPRDTAVNVAYRPKKMNQYYAAAENNGKDGVEALQAFDREPFDLVLMDMAMPNMDGYTATRMLKGERACAIPVIALTAHAMKGDRDKCITAGCDDYLAKPVGRQELLEMLHRWLAVAQAPRHRVQG